MGTGGGEVILKLGHPFQLISVEGWSQPVIVQRKAGAFRHYVRYISDGKLDSLMNSLI